MPKLFTLDEAREFLPRLRELMRQAINAKTQYQAAETKWQELIRRILLMGGILLDRTDAAITRDQQNRSGERLKNAVEEIHSQGVLIKDLDTGLADFPTLFHDKEVYLCWKLGEEDIEYWHGVDEGFAGRKAIDEEFLANHRGGFIE